MRVSGIGASEAAGNISPWAATANTISVSGTGSDLLPFDFAAVLWIATGEGSPTPEPEATPAAAIGNPDMENPTPSPEERDPAGWRPGNGWLPIPGLNLIAFANIPVELDRTFSFEQPVENGSENPTAQSPSSAQAAPDVPFAPISAPGATEQPAGPPPNPLAFQLRLTETGSSQTPGAANQVAEIPAPPAPAVHVPSAEPADPPTPSVLLAHPGPNPLAESIPQTEPVSATEPIAPAEPALEAKSNTAPEEHDENLKSASHSVAATSKHETASEKHDGSSGSGTGEGQSQRPPQPPVHPMSSPTPTFEVSGHTATPRATAEAPPQSVTSTTTVAAPPLPSAGPVSTVHIRLESADAPQPVDVHVRERGGEIHVAVRGADLGLNQELRQDLPSLLRRLEELGFQGEAWAGRETEKLQAIGGPEGSSDANAQNGQKNGESSRGREQQERQSHPDRDPSRQRRDRNWQNAWVELTD